MFVHTGHPLVDVGVATITAYLHKSNALEVTADDMDKVANYVEDQYGKNPMRSFLTVLFPNSGYVQPAFDRFPEKRKAYADQLLRGHRGTATVDQRHCVFCGRQAGMMAFRQHIPLLGGENVFNFYPEGGLGLPVCAACMLAIQVFPLGSTKCNGRALIVHSDCSDVTQAFASRFLEKNLQILQMAGLDKMPDVRFPRTLLVETLMSIEKDRLRVNRRQPCSITAYHLTNYGTNADITIYQLPLGLMSFILEAADTPTYQTAWHSLVARGWEISKAQARGKADDQEKGETQRRNFLYEDLFTLPDEARRFLQTYFLRRPLRRTFDTDPRRTYSLAEDLGLISWSLTSLFLERVMNMDRTRITAIQQLADGLADYVISQDNRLFLQIHHTRGYPDLRRRLVTANIASVRAGKPPLLTFDTFLEVFEEGEDIARPDWSLARDLVLIRMIERMHEAGVFEQHPELAEQAVEAAQSEESRDEIPAAV